MNKELYDLLENKIVAVYDNDTIQLAINYLEKRKKMIEKQLVEE